jgi:MerR family mercuric resistance operon transcriptional regulator
LGRLRFIKRAQQLGFTLDEIAELLELSDGGGCASACGVAEHRLADIERRMVDLASMQQALRRLVGRCRENLLDAPCPLVEAFRDGV